MIDPTKYIDLPKIHFSFGDLLVDFFGCLVPGFVFFSLTYCLLSIPLLLVRQLGLPYILFDLTLWVKDNNVIFIPLFIILSYIIGHFFYRMDPKIPDKESYWFIRDSLENSGPVQENFNGQKFIKKSQLKKAIADPNNFLHKYGNWKEYKNQISVEYPYSHLKEYLIARGFTDLARLIPWSTKDIKKRSKHFINSLKIRLSNCGASVYGQIARNEAHVRLMSSVWYMMNLVQKICIISFLANILITVIKVFPISNNEIELVKDGWFWFLLSTPIFSYIIIEYLKRKIMHFFHYQRIREIVFVLETAYFIHYKRKDKIFIHNKPSDDFT